VVLCDESKVDVFEPLSLRLAAGSFQYDGVQIRSHDPAAAPHYTSKFQGHITTATAQVQTGHPFTNAKAIEQSQSVRPHHAAEQPQAFPAFPPSSNYIVVHRILTFGHWIGKPGPYLASCFFIIGLYKWTKQQVQRFVNGFTAPVPLGCSVKLRFDHPFFLSVAALRNIVCPTARRPIRVTAP
jgi:hypothetical protein